MHTIGNINYYLPGTGAGQKEARKMTMNRKKLYWLCQVLGWSLIVLLNLVIISTFKSIEVGNIITALCFAILGVTFTHIFRKIIKKGNWLELPLKQIIPRVIISSIIMGVIIFVLVYVIGHLTGIMPGEKLTPVKSIVGITNTSGITLVWALIYFSIHYLENYKKTEIEALIWEAAVKDYELKTLKSQLNPHFMFNAMNSIRALIEEDPENAKAAITKLSNILRFSLKMERAEKVVLGEEIENVKDYLGLEKIRFEERLSYCFNIDAASARVEIPPMMIQTLVENGIKHGVSKIAGGGEINIKSEVDNSKLYIEIKNDGHLDENTLKNSKGFGISNTKHRLNLLYGEKASFSLTNENGRKVSAKLVIPI